MATRAWIAKALRKPKFSSRRVTRCRLCGRRRGYLRRFSMCRLCFRKHALEGNLPGVIKASW